MIRLGLIVNPLAGIGGSVGLKGSDGAETIAQALALGAEKKAGLRTLQTLQRLAPLKDQCQFVSCPGDMGATWLAQAGLTCSLLDLPSTDGRQSTRDDTLSAARLMLDEALDVLLFAGGDGTARDICSVVADQLPVLGIPAGVKIHSGVYGITPVASAEVICQLVNGGLVDIREAEVRDLDEDAFRQGEVRARHYGDMRVPMAGHFIQAVKQGGVEQEALVLADIAATVQQEMDDGCLYLIGSGKTTQGILAEMGLDGTLLGVDAVLDGQLIGRDLNEQGILALLDVYPQRQAVLSVMGGQGHIIGRGNQQFSRTVLTRIGRDNILLVSTKTKITALAGRPLVIDSGDSQFDAHWAGTMEILTGYQDRILYPVG
ncbi:MULTISPECIES: ATP-NAD kinase family protein [unclassified Oceanobacter]|uniref:ATP-NAD kinase family protein n=1 Tax=unclassified Oceanobacter TaxID=2620260 RepID=UPI0027371A14|nr:MULTISPECIES: ATP-NAD kinase family protein [unclassified Oceanobacter]MDP2608858.1 ATP-NAD kinase family protein [Oceanobacter sp. 1_MG-2023]MDP2611900.1 ATP-NAD kinase family protein [Oceanobacter sp. 2_MG-2023]